MIHNKIRANFYFNANLNLCNWISLEKIIDINNYSLLTDCYKTSRFQFSIICVTVMTHKHFYMHLLFAMHLQKLFYKIKKNTTNTTRQMENFFSNISYWHIAQLG